MNKPFYVSQNFTIWAESPEQAARLVRQGQSYALLNEGYRTFDVVACETKPDGSVRRGKDRMQTIVVND